MTKKSTYKTALSLAVMMMDANEHLEPTSALKEAANQSGIAWGDDMGRFVRWAYTQLGVSHISVVA